MENKLSPEQRIQAFIKKLEADIEYHNSHYPEDKKLTLTDVLAYIQSREYEERIVNEQNKEREIDWGSYNDDLPF